MTKGEGSRGGHIIGHTKSGAPIYGDRAQSSASRIGKAAGKVVAGAALTVAGGYLAGGIVRKAAKFGNLAHDAAKHGGASVKFAHRMRIAEKVLGHTEVAVKYSTSAAGSALIGEGAADSIKDTKYDKDNNRIKLGLAAASSSAILSRTGLYANVLAHGPGKVRKAFGMALKKGPKPIERPEFQSAFKFGKRKHP